MTTQLEVSLHDQVIGYLVDEGHETSFRFRSSYWDDPGRCVLGQWFEDGRPDDVYRGPGSLPAFFSNLEPEGALGRWLSRRNNLGEGALELLGVAGDDLPGAVRLIRVEPVNYPPRSVVYRAPPKTPSFSLAGVQLKLPMSLDRDDRLVLSLPGELSDWFAKIPKAGRYQGLIENEAATMNWARHSGFAVAECHVHSVSETLGLELQLEPGWITSALLVRRYDRSPKGRIHQEDLAQAQWLDPEQKYPLERNDRSRFDDQSEHRRRGLASVEGTGRYVARLLGITGFEEYLRRFVFVVASGNGDAHLKNWSLWYPEGHRPQWTPLYDQVSTVAFGPLLG